MADQKKSDLERSLDAERLRRSIMDNIQLEAATWKLLEGVDEVAVVAAFVTSVADIFCNLSHERAIEFFDAIAEEVRAVEMGDEDDEAGPVAVSARRIAACEALSRELLAQAGMAGAAKPAAGRRNLN